MYNTKWSLDALYKGFDHPKFKEDYENLPKEIAKITDFAKNNFGDTSNPGQKMEEYVEICNGFSAYYNLLSFASLTLEANTQDAEALKIMDSVEQELTALVLPNTMFKKFLTEIENFEEIVESSPLLKEHSFVLNEIKEEAHHMLSQEEEMVLAKLRLTGSGAWSTLYGQLTSTLEVELNREGEDKKLPLSAARNLAYEKDLYLRKTAYFAELNAYPKIEKALSMAISSIKGESTEIATMRKYDSVLDMTLKSSRMDRTTLDALIGAMEESLPIFRKYFKHKAKILGHKEGLPFYDLFAPVGRADMTFTKEEAADFVVKNFTAFSQDMGDFTKMAFEKSWVDWEPRENKVGGAFCANLHNIKESRVLMNFSGSFDNVLTLAHEFGHAYHGDALKDASYLNSDYSMPIAEVASIFCETLVCHAALKEANKDEKLAILENNLQGMSQVIVDIYSRYLFETEVIKRRTKGSLTSEELKEIMLDSQKTAYGDGLSSYHPYMWACKPHYYFADANFYNFPYAYGLLFAKGLFAIYLKDPGFADRYKSLLTATGQNSLADVGKIVDIDVRDKKFWQGAVGMIEKDVDEFIGLL